jgi:hypothetical protein
VQICTTHKTCMTGVDYLFVCCLFFFETSCSSFLHWKIACSNHQIFALDWNYPLSHLFHFQYRTMFKQEANKQRMNKNKSCKIEVTISCLLFVHLYWRLNLLFCSLLLCCWKFLLVFCAIGGQCFHHNSYWSKKVVKKGLQKLQTRVWKL